MPIENTVVKPAHSLLRQSQKATEAKLEVNGDGFGIAWYGQDPIPGLYRDVVPAWADDNLTNMCRLVRSPLFIGHVHASKIGETTRANCHPFTYENWVFCHSGQIAHFAQIRRRLEAALPDHLHAARRGTTDSEMVFLTLLANGLRDDPQAAIADTLAQIGTGDAGPVKLTCVFSDGEALFGYRHSTSGIALTLYTSGLLDNGGVALASEPLCGVASRWQEVPENTLVRLTQSKAAIAA